MMCVDHLIVHWIRQHANYIVQCYDFILPFIVTRRVQQFIMSFLCKGDSSNARDAQKDEEC